MRKIGYPELNEHIKMHKKLVKVLEAYKSDYDSNIINSFVFKNFLFVWVRDHILEDDMKIGQYINSG